MSILSDHEIRIRRKMIEPFVEHTNEVDGKKAISFGLSSYGYDVRLANEFKVFANTYSIEIDPKNFDPRNLVDVEAVNGSILIPANSFALGRSLEYIRVPRDLMIICIGKSTYARTGLVANVTPLEPEWEGFITIEISNTAPLPARVYANEGIIQLIFLRADKLCTSTYASKGGKYQKQMEITLPR